MRLESLEGSSASNAIVEWMAVEVAAGDSWAQGLIEAELMPLLLPKMGQVWLCRVDDHDVGCAHLSGTRRHPLVRLWLDPQYWNTQVEIAVLKAVLDTLAEVPEAIDLHLGSEGHLRASVAQFKVLHMQPVLLESIVMVKTVLPVSVSMNTGKV